MLHYLSLHERQLVSQQALAKHLWPDTFVEANNIKKYILEIRRALQDDPKQPIFIETLSRRGYRFLAAVHAVGISSGQSPQSASRVPVVGRDSHIASLEELFANAEAGERQIVFLTGEPGSGKTTVITEFLKLINVHPRIHYGIGHCLEMASDNEAHYPLFEIFEDLCDADLTGTTARTLGEQAPALISHLSAHIFHEHRHLLERVSRQTHSLRTMSREIIRAIELLARTEPLILIIEDMQWADRATVDLVNAIARRDIPAKLMLIATCRSPMPSSMELPIKKVKQDLSCHSLCAHVHVDRISRQDIAAYLTQLQPKSKPIAQLIDVLYKASGGNPFLMQATLEDLVAQGACHHSKGEWRFTSPSGPLRVPPKVRQFIELQLDSFPEEIMELLEAASVAGSSFSALEVAAALGWSPAFAEACIMECVNTGHFIRVSHGTTESLAGKWEFVLEYFRRVIYEDIVPARKQKMHLRIADWLETAFIGRDARIDSLIATHFQKAHEWTRAVPYLLLSSDPASREGAIIRALKLLHHRSV